MINDTQESREPSPKCFKEISEVVGTEVDSTYGSMLDRYLAKPLIAFHRGNSSSGKK